MREEAVAIHLGRSPISMPGQGGFPTNWTEY